MSSPETLTQKWLRQNIATYNDGSRVFADVDSTLSLYPTLRPKTDVYTYDDGRTQLLLCIHGLLPIDYRQASYHIPIAIWITRQYPREPPLAFVVPTSEMLVKPSKHVDVSGLCRMDYIGNWEKKYEGCDLQSLVQAMKRYFSNEPPVYSKPKPQSGPTGSSRPSQDAPSRPPPPVPHPSLNPPPPIASPLASPSPSRPTPPPKPQSTIPPVIPLTLPPSVHAPHFDSHSQYHRTPNPPPKPPLPPPLFSSPSLPLHSLDPTHLHNRASSFGATFQSQPAPSVWHGTPTIQPPEPIPSSPRRTLLPGQTHSSLSGAAFSPYHPPEHRPAAPDPQQQQQSITAPLDVNLLDQDDTTADDTPPLPVVQAAPPRPPNPELLQLHARAHEKLRAELASVSQAMSLDGERLRAQQADLLTGVPAIRDEMGRLEAVRDVCRGVASRLRQVIQTAERGVAELKRKGDPPVDELVCSTSIVHNQLVELVAEDSAIEDTMYHLHRALNAGRIDLDRFLRTTRVLAEEQFMKRALIERIQTSLPMGASVHPGWA
ncbi:UEV domain-containing protein [Russula ochroleuca]|uniref:UEV domain-containing protein n=1 Tax=Russula ochroleuca TaxID=152965 RepID=A0A9P5T6V0_9AGAM|nr:UEV domain-containing protein [Russula ochroleuca]